MAYLPGGLASDLLLIERLENDTPGVHEIVMRPKLVVRESDGLACA